MHVHFFIEVTLKQWEEKSVTTVLLHIPNWSPVVLGYTEMPECRLHSWHSKMRPSVDGHVCLHQRWSHILHAAGKQNKKTKQKNKNKKRETKQGKCWKFVGRQDQMPVGARRLMKAMLLRHILLKKMGQAGFMMKCSRRIRSSVNKVLCGNRLVKPFMLSPVCLLLTND